MYNGVFVGCLRDDMESQSSRASTTIKKIIFTLNETYMYEELYVKLFPDKLDSQLASTAHKDVQDVMALTGPNKPSIFVFCD